MVEVEIKEIQKKLMNEGVTYALAQFVDIHGVAKTKAVPMAHFESIFTSGAGFAAFAVEGFGLPPSGPDYMAVGDIKSLRKMTWMPGTVRVACNGVVNNEPHNFDTRVICERLMNELRAKHNCEFFTGLEPEFFLLKKDPATNKPVTGIESDTLAKPCYDYRILHRAAPVVFEISNAMIASGIDVYQIDHEDANGQFEVNFTYSDGLTTADNLVFFKMAASEIAFKNNMICSFMPKPFTDRPGNGMHMHLSMGKDGKNLFTDASDKNGIGLSKLGYHFLAGLLHHSKALTAIACPSVNSYKRLVGSGSVSGATWAPTSICYGDNNRTAAVRVPYGRLEFRTPDSSANPYLLTAAVIAAGLDGIERKLDPGQPVNKNLYEMSAAEKRELGINTLPQNLLHALEHLEKNEYLVNKLGPEFIEEFIKIKRNEWNQYHTCITEWEMNKYLEFY